nr:IS110 family transposase [Pseudorhodobacter turbinis]
MSKQGDKMVRKHLYEAATTLLRRNLRSSSLKTWGMKLAKVPDFRKGLTSKRRVLRSPGNLPWLCTPCGKPTRHSVGPSRQHK